MAKWLIKLGEISLRLLYPFIISLFRVVQTKSKQYLVDEKNKNLSFIFVNVMFLSEIIGGSWFFFESYFARTKSTKSQVRLTKIRITLVQNVEERNTRRLLLSISGLMLLDLIGSNGVNIIGTHIYNHIIKVFVIFFYAFLSVKILKYQIFRHQYFALALIFIGVVLTTVGFEYQINSNVQQFILFFVLILLCQSLFGLKNTLEKWLMHFKSIESLYILFYEGVFSFVLSGIINVILYFCNFFKDFLFTSGVYWYFLIVLISGIIINVCIFKTNEHFSPIYLLIANLFSSFIDYIIDLILKREDREVTFSLVGYFIMILGMFIYNELLLFNCFGLGEYTKEMIGKRAIKEYFNSIVEIPLINELEMDNFNINNNNELGDIAK